MLWLNIENNKMIIPSPNNKARYAYYHFDYAINELCSTNQLQINEEPFTAIRTKKTIIALSNC